MENIGLSPRRAPVAGKRIGMRRSK